MLDFKNLERYPIVLMTPHTCINFATLNERIRNKAYTSDDVLEWSTVLYQHSLRDEPYIRGVMDALLFNKEPLYRGVIDSMLQTIDKNHLKAMVEQMCAYEDAVSEYNQGVADYAIYHYEYEKELS